MLLILRVGDKMIEFQEFRKISRLSREITIGYMNPEGIVIYHKAGNVLFKKLLRKTNSQRV